MRRTVFAVLLVIAGLSATAAQAAGPEGNVLFASNRIAAGSYEIFSQSQSGGAPVNLTNTDNTESDYDPAWSPDGRRITWTKGAGGDQDIWIMNRDGSGKMPLTVNAGEDQNAVFSPDGKRIAFTSDRGTGWYDVYVMNANGTNPVRLTFGTSSSTENQSPEWSPDGTKIAFLSERAGGNNDREIFVMNADGSGQAQLTFNPAQTLAPKFSPDGKLILFAALTAPGDNFSSELFSMSAAGGAPARLTTNTVRDRGGSFSRDGLARIFFLRDVPMLSEEIYVMNRDGSNLLLFAGSPNSDLSPAPEPAATCQKKRATIIGTSKPDTLVGGPGPDVISGQGGKDKIKGKGGKDIICGDAGKDNLNGGPGKDLINGGKGNDEEIGGKGKDTCVGGKGDDSAKACEKEKAL